MRNPATHCLCLPLSIVAAFSLVAAEEIPFNGSAPEQAAEAAPDTSETTTSSPRKPGNFGRLKDWKPSDPKPSAAIEQSNGDNTARPQRGGSGSGSGGMAGFENRLKAVGAKTGDLQISIAWNSLDDVDLHVTFSPNHSTGPWETISFGSKYGPKTGGYLDIDMNYKTKSTTPVENVFYPVGKTPGGRYFIKVHLYRSRTGNMSVPVVLRIKNRDKITFHEIQATQEFDDKCTVLYDFIPPRLHSNEQERKSYERRKSSRINDVRLPD